MGIPVEVQPSGDNEESWWVIRAGTSEIPVSEPCMVAISQGILAGAEWVKTRSAVLESVPDGFTLQRIRRGRLVGDVISIDADSARRILAR